MDTALFFTYAVRALVMLIAIPLHEFAHAFASHLLGDDTAKRQGRLTLNPLAHLDIMGVICMIFIGFGWAKPVPISTRGFKRPKLGMALTALAGPVSNLLLAFISVIIYKVLFYLPDFGMVKNVLLIIFNTMLSMNIMLAVFNLIPIPPLDGSRVLLVFLPKSIYFGLMKYERYIIIALFVALMTGVLSKPLSVAANYIILLFDNATMFIDIIFKSVLI